MSDSEDGASEEELEEEAEMADDTKTINTNNPERDKVLIDEEIMVVEASKDDINGLVVCDAKKGGGIVGVFLTPSEGELISKVIYDKANLSDNIKAKDRKGHFTT